MAYHPVRNILGLSVLYSTIILGIFSLQFRNESFILQNFDSLHLRLSTATVQNGSIPAEFVLENSFQVSGNGMVLFANESTPLILQNANDEFIPLVLQDWKENSKYSFTLLFSENVSLAFSSAGDQFDIHALLPSQANFLTIPYKTTDNYTVTDILHNKIIFESKNEILSFQASEITENTIILSATSGAIAKVAVYEETLLFSFDSIINLENASSKTLAFLSDQMRAKLVQNYPSIEQEFLNENFVAAYIAELASQKKYNEGLANIPASFIDSTKRTYFTAPYFNTLSRMNQTLVMENEHISYSMEYSIDRNVLDVFELDRFPSFLLQQSPSNITTILSLPASLDDFEPTIAQATGILDAYTSLFSLQPASAALLEPILAHCIEVIESSSILSGSSLSLVEGTATLDTILSVKTGRTLLDYGKITSREDLQAGGTLLIVSALQNNPTLDSNTMASIYPYVAENNPYYPHGDVIAYENGNPVWAWNISTTLKYSKDPSGNVSIDIEFPVNEVHHMIINGIEPFSSIEIYGLIYGSDPRFETWDSPGYVYFAETKTLLLKYRQRTTVERLRIFYTATGSQ